MIREKAKCLDRKQFFHSNQDGVATLFFIVIILAMSVLTGYMLELTTTSTFGELSYNHLERAYFMAEAGGHYATTRVKQDIMSDTTYDDTYSLHNQTFILDEAGGSQEGQFKILVDDTNPDHTLIHSIGSISSGISSNVEVKLTYSMSKTSSALFEKVLFAGNELTLKKDATIDGDIASNASSISKDSGVTITGNEETSVGRTLTPIIFTCDTCVDDKEINGSETWFNGTFEYLKVTITQNATLTISGDVILYVKEDFLAGIGSTIKLLSDSSLTIYVDKTAIFKKDFALEFDPLPDRAEDFVIYGTSNAKTIALEKEVTFIGAIYAPSADVMIKKAQKFVGAIVGDTVIIDKEASITYDARVKDITTPISAGVTIGRPKQYFSP